MVWFKPRSEVQQNVGHRSALWSAQYIAISNQLEHRIDAAQIIVLENVDERYAAVRYLENF